jgi:outer membrane protein assembly factor BamB
MSGKLACLGLADGKLRWSFDAKSPLEASPLYCDGTVYVGSSAGELFAVDAARGRIRWRYRAADRIAGAANRAVTPSGTLILVGSYDGLLQAVDARTGARRWGYQTSNFVNGCPAVTADGKAIFGGCDGFVHVLRVQDGRGLARIDSGAYIAGSPAVLGKRAYIGNYSGKLMAMDIEAGSVAWSLAPEGEEPFSSSPAVGNGRVVAGARNGTVYCTDAATGAEIWTFRTAASVAASPVVAGGVVILAAGDGTVTALELATGKELWSYDAGAAVSGSVAVVPGRILFGTEDGRLYAIGD